MLRVALLNGKNKNHDRDFSKILEAIASDGIISGFDIDDGMLQPGKGFVTVTRAGVDTFYCYVENTTEVAVDVTGTKKVWLEVKQANINDGTLNSPDGSGILELKTGASYPTDNYLKIASITGGIITDERKILNILNSVLPVVAFNKSIKDLNDVYAFTNPTGKKYLAWDTVNSKWNALDIETIDLPGFSKSLSMGENISNGKVVSLMKDGKLYAVVNNKRLLSNGSITGQSYTRSCLLPSNKIATIGISGSTITIWIGLINFSTNTIAYGTGVQLTTNAVSNTQSLYLCMAGTDKLSVFYQSTSYYGVGRGVTVSGDVPTVGAEVTVVTNGYSPPGTYPGTVQYCCYVADGKVAVGAYQGNNGSTNSRISVLTLSGTTLTLGSNTGGYGTGSGFNDMQYVADNIIVAINRNGNSSTTYISLITVSGSVPTRSTDTSLGNTTANKLATDGTNIRCLSSATNVVKFTYSGGTLTSVYNATVDSSSGLCLNGSLIGVVSSTSLIWYSDKGTTLTKRNTIDYGVSLAQLYENSYSPNYNIITISGNPSYIYKIGNEIRNTIGYIVTGGNKDANTVVSIDGAIITGLSNIIPGETYYVDKVTGNLLLDGDLLFGKGISTTTIKLAISYIA